MNLRSRLHLAYRVLVELGPRQVFWYILYRAGLHSGYYRFRTPAEVKPAFSAAPGYSKSAQLAFNFALRLPESAELHQVMDETALAQALHEADEITHNRVSLFGRQAAQLELNPGAALETDGQLAHWTAYELGRLPHSSQAIPGSDQAELTEDIKFTWEPARFGWSFSLVRAYRLTSDERYAEAFWNLFDTFQTANPTNRGPNWTSAQEVALRLLALAFARMAFSASPHTTEARAARLIQAIIAHARRIPPTLAYARAQNNNHLLSEAVGLYTAGVCLPDHPQASYWCKLGWKWFNQGLQSQIDRDGAYCQHSTNYHRLMLQLALWFNWLAASQSQAFPDATQQRLASATRWLLALVDPLTGQAPNLGPNDSANLFPLASCPFEDYRPVMQAAGQAFLGERPFSNGPWDELAVWLNPNQPTIRSQLTPKNQPIETPHIIRKPGLDTWAYLRLAKFRGRPGHADQLHLDLWWRGLNVACDAGTYSYNALPPWDNALMGAAVHNTLTVNGLDQMQRAGRFLYLDWAQAEQIEGLQNKDGSWQRLVARHTGYRRLGLIHQRTVEVLQDGCWLIEDTLLPIKTVVSSSKARPDAARPDPTCQVRLHWLLPDWPWELSGGVLRLKSRFGPLDVSLSAGSGVEAGNVQICLARAGESLAGSGPVYPSSGWVSPTYGVRLPALSLCLYSQASPPVVFSTRWHFPVKSDLG